MAKRFIGGGTLDVSLAASEITSGTLSADRIPNLSASKISSGTLSADRIPSIFLKNTGSPFPSYDVGAEGEITNGVGESITFSNITNTTILKAGGSARLTAKSNGRIEIGDRILLGGAAEVNSYRIVLPNLSSTAGRGLSSGWHTYSDGRIKRERETLPYGLKEVLKLSPLRYQQHSSSVDKDGKILIGEESGTAIGLIAQDVLNIIPEVVNPPEDEEKGLYSLDYVSLIPVLIKAVQEQQALISSLQAKVEALEANAWK